MFIVDDILTSPFRGLLWIFEEICDAAEQELGHEADAIAGRLHELYVMLETHRITEDEFERRESELLDRLDKLRDNGAFIADA